VATGEADRWGRTSLPACSEDEVVFPANEPYPDHHADTLEILLKSGADATVNDRCGFLGTGPEAALHSDNLAGVRKLLAAGAEVTKTEMDITEDAYPRPLALTTEIKRQAAIVL
jgi:hypothetical protein